MSRQRDRCVQVDGKIGRSALLEQHAITTTPNFKDANIDPPRNLDVG